MTTETAEEHGKGGGDMTLHDQLVRLGACPEAVRWVGDRDLATAWAECERADWML